MQKFMIRTQQNVKVYSKVVELWVIYFVVYIFFIFQT